MRVVYVICIAIPFLSHEALQLGLVDFQFHIIHTFVKMALAGKQHFDF
jgi:hypothetical protein